MRLPMPVCVLVSLSAIFKLDYSKSCERILMKFSGGVGACQEAIK